MCLTLMELTAVQNVRVNALYTICNESSGNAIFGSQQKQPGQPGSHHHSRDHDRSVTHCVHILCNLSVQLIACSRCRLRHLILTANDIHSEGLEALAAVVESVLSLTEFVIVYASKIIMTPLLSAQREPPWFGRRG